MHHRRWIATLAGSIIALSVGVWLLLAPRAANDSREAGGIVEAVPQPPGETPPAQVEPRTAEVPKPLKVDSITKDQGAASGVPGGVEIGADRSPVAPPGELPMVSWEEATTHLISPVQPAYPRAALAARRSGAVMLQVEISPEGTVTDARVLVGADDFAESAMAAVMQSRFRPFLVQGRPVAVRTQARYVFRLQ